MKANVFNSVSNNSVSNNSVSIVALYESVTKKQGKSALATVQYVPIKKAIKMLNIALENEDRKIVSARFKEELRAAGFDKFTMQCVHWAWTTNALILPPKEGDSDFRIVHARIDEFGRKCYDYKDLLRSFEMKYSWAIDAMDARIQAEKEAKRAENQAKKEVKANKMAEAYTAQKEALERVLGHALTDAQMAELKKNIKVA